MIITGYNEAVLAHALLEWIPLLHVSTFPFSFTAPALALLLVFRTNVSYTRLDEARKAWGSTINRTRDIVRQDLTWMRHPADAEKLHWFLKYAACFPYTLKDHVVQDDDTKSELSSLLDTKELEAVLTSTHPPNSVLQIMSEIVHSSKMQEMEQAIMDANITELHENLGSGDRIFRTPIPLSYTRLTSRDLIIWHLALPLALWDQCTWIAIPATFLSASALFCIDEVGVLIEEPFPLLALQDLCDSVRKNIQGLVAAHKYYHQTASSKETGCDISTLPPTKSSP